MRPRPEETNPKYSYDEDGARYYRESEEKSIQFGSRKHYCGILKDLSASFERRISVLDVGCGTGRYFHCLQNVERLLGLDISQSMLDQALNPVKKDEIRIGDVSLLCADIFEVSLPPAHLEETGKKNQCRDNSQTPQHGRIIAVRDGVARSAPSFFLIM